MGIKTLQRENETKIFLQTSVAFGLGIVPYVCCKNNLIFLLFFSDTAFLLNRRLLLFFQAS